MDFESPGTGFYCLTSPTVLEAIPDTQAEARRSFILVFSCTLIGALAQILVKQGTAQLGAHIALADVVKDPSLFVRFCFGIISNLRLFTGYCLYGINTFLLAVALKGRELSRLYPIIALTYVWVTLLSLFILPGEHMNFFRAIGIVFIVGGVSVLGMKK
jgi:multidrug transporter EmrE-like cation transporter